MNRGPKALSWLFTLVPLAAQAIIEPPPIAVEQAVPCTIEGIVADSETGVGIPDISVSLARSAVLQRVKTSDAGRFAFSGDLCGRIEVSAERTANYLGKSKVIRLVPGQSIKGLKLEVSKPAWIIGRVVNAAKEPEAGVRVELRARTYRYGLPAYTVANMADTNDRGEFRLFGSEGRKFALCVVPPRKEFVLLAADSPMPEEKEEDPAPSAAVTCLGNAVNQDLGIPVEARSGQLLELGDIYLRRENSVCVLIELAVSGETSGEWIVVSLMEEYRGSQTRVATGRFRSAGTARVCGVTPGSYQLIAASTSPDGKPLLAVRSLTVTGSKSIRLGRIVLEPLRPVTGKVRIEGEEARDTASKRAPVPQVRVLLEPKIRLQRHGETLLAANDESGRFSFPFVFWDEFWVVVRAIPPGYYVKSVLAAGRDAHRSGFQAGSGELEVTLGSDGPNFTGTVLNRENQPEGGSTVALLSLSPSEPPLQNEHQFVVAGDDGRFRVLGMPPGEYLVAAFRNLPLHRHGDPQVFMAIRSQGKRISLPPKSVLDLSVPARENP